MSEFTKGEWKACHNGECSCKQIWCDDYPVATVNAGKWGDDYCSIRLVGESSLTLKAEAYMEQITYGEIKEKTAIANARLIAAAPDMYEALKAIMSYFDSPDIQNASDYFPQMREALAKADGN